MKRRDLLGAMVGLPALVVGAAAVTAAAPIRLDTRAVGVDFSVFDDGDGLRFTMKLFDQPWPRVGQPLTFAYDGLEFAGTVTRTRAESVHGSGRFLWHMDGTVQHFEARPVTERCL